tara:strand:- start:644 stop:1699 length:1056 start_codon:yes stop_codon:yes gene_type:complete
MINSFKTFLVEEEKTAYWTFGRMNPPTIGHMKLLDALAKKAGKNPIKVFLSQSQDKKKNPLSYADKVKFARKMFPKHARSIMLDKSVKTFIDAAKSLESQGFKKIVMIVGSDRVTQFDTVLSKYNGKDYTFQDIKVVSAGERDPDADGAEGASATKQREAAKDNNFATFSQGLPKEMSNSDAKKLFNAVRSGLGLKESKQYRQHVDLGVTSKVREKYIEGKLFEAGDEVVIKSTGQVGTVKILGSNYVIIEHEGGKYRKWLEDVELLEKEKEHKKDSPQDPDIKSRPGTQPKAYHKGVSKSKKAARDAHFKRGAKMDDDNPAAYKKAPGDAGAKTKPSKHTKRFKKMFGDD